MIKFGYSLFFMITIQSFIKCRSLLYSTDMETKNECQLRNNESIPDDIYNHCPKNKDPIKLHFELGNLNGSVIAEFLLDPPVCPQLLYEIELLPSIDTDENQTCHEASPDQPHSRKSLKILRCDSNCTNLCGKYGRIQFFNVEPGCYKAQVRQHITDLMHHKKRSTNWTYIGYQGNADLSTAVLIDFKEIVTFDFGMNLSMTFSKPTSYVIIELNNKGVMKMNMSMLLENRGCHFSRSESSLGKITKYDGLTCSFTSLTEKNTSVKVYVFMDEQCNDEFKYEEPIRHDHLVCWRSETKSQPENIPGDTLKASPIFIGIMVPSFALVLIISCFIYKQLLKRRKSRHYLGKGETALLTEDSISNDHEILLLYAKDCKEFMVTMESFRQMLGELCNVKVHDCFNEPGWEDEQISPREWLERIIKFKPSLRIILVSTLSACIQQKRFQSGKFNGQVSAFSDPSHLDKIFLYGLKILKDYETSNQAYGKIFLIKLNGFSDDTNSKELSSLSRVYQIPLHLNLLIRDMKNASSKMHSPEEDDVKIKYPDTEIDYELDSQELSDFTNCESHGIFLHHLEELKDFKRSNKYYLTGILKPLS